MAEKEIPPADGQLQLGGIAPDFELSDGQGQLWRLSALRGRQNVLLIFNLGFT